MDAIRDDPKAHSILEIQLNRLLAIGTLIALVAAPCGAATETAAQANAEAARFERKSDAYAMAAKQYLAAGKPITTAQARRYTYLSDMYRRLAARSRS
jgi:hypothetical protein